MTFGERLRALRKQQDKTQEELSVIFETNRPTYSNWENNRNTPGFTVLRKIAKYFNVSIDYLLGGEEDDVPRDSGHLVLTPEVFTVLQRYQNLSPESRRLVNDFINHFAELEKGKQNLRRGDNDERL